MEELKTEFKSAFKGREYWIDLKVRYRVDENCFLIICPTDNFLLNVIAMENLTDFLTRKYIKRAVILSLNPKLEKDYPFLTDVNVQFVQVEQEKMECILNYYKLTQFTKNIVVISLEQPFGNENIVGKKGITLTDYVKDAIYV